MLMRKIDKSNIAPPELRAPGTPDTVIVTLEAPPPFAEADLGIKVDPRPGPPAKHRLVTIGDSLTHGFQSGAIFNTDLSWPVLVAEAGGFENTFRRPHYAKYGGLPLNFEYLVRYLEDHVGPDLSNPFNKIRALFWLRSALGDICHYWQDGDGAIVPPASQINHNLATFGYDLRDALALAPENIRNKIQGSHENAIAPIVSHGKERAALRTLPYNDPAKPMETFPSMTSLEAATRLGQEGIETLVVFLGANNVLATTFDLRLCWSGAGYDRLGTAADPGKDAYNIWQPNHFAAEFEKVAAAVRGIGAKHVIWGTVPHVTIVPLLHGLRGKITHPDNSRSRYFAYYGRPWMDDASFDPDRDPHLTSQDARTMDSAIDQYNDSIADAVAAARRSGLDWRLLDLCGILDRLAARRYIKDEAARPAWWTQYPLPPALAALTPTVDSQFFLSKPTGRGVEGRRIQGGLFALDGVHPTTVAYGIMAHEVLRVMREADVQGYRDIDFKELLGRDSLMSAPPAGLGEDFSTVGWFDKTFDFAKHIFGRAVTPDCPKASKPPA
jgi:hypothetical protein